MSDQRETPAPSPPEPRSHAPYVRLLTNTEHPEDSDRDIALSEIFDSHDHSTLQASPKDSILASQLTVAIDDPQVLLSLGDKMSKSLEGVSTTPIRSASSVDVAENSFSLEADKIRIIQIELLAPVSLTDELTLCELNGAIDGPVMSNLVSSWRLAFRSLPHKHTIELVRFDMRCQQKVEVRHIIRLIQEVATAMYMKAKMSTGRELAFEVTGCENSEKQSWLEASLPGPKQVEHTRSALLYGSR